MNAKGRICAGLIFLFAIACVQEPATKQAKYKNGDLDQSFSEASVVNQVEKAEKQAELKLLAEGWSPDLVKNGNMPDCYNYKRKSGEYDNQLSIEVGGGTDVVVKLINIKTNKCVRYVYINSGTTYNVKRIPEGVYRLRIAYGKNWYSKVEQQKCIGKFLKNAIYEEGEEIMDFRVQRTFDGISIPSFSLRLDVISSDRMNTFNSNTISEEAFNS